MVVALASTDEELFGAGEVEGEVSPPGGGQVREGHRGGAQHLGQGGLGNGVVWSCMVSSYLRKQLSVRCLMY